MELSILIFYFYFWRYTSIASAIPHCATKDGITFDGYNIPRNAQVWPNYYAVHYDPENFPDPYTFTLDHFLNKNGEFINADKCVAFGVGESLVYMCVCGFVAYIRKEQYI